MSDLAGASVQRTKPLREGEGNWSIWRQFERIEDKLQQIGGHSKNTKQEMHIRKLWRPLSNERNLFYTLHGLQKKPPDR